MCGDDTGVFGGFLSIMFFCGIYRGLGSGGRREINNMNAVWIIERESEWAVSIVALRFS